MHGLTATIQVRQFSDVSEQNSDHKVSVFKISDGSVRFGYQITEIEPSFGYPHSPINNAVLLCLH
jgi:hypothetical protein